jgi:predicted metalloprotease with PDZ domain
MSGDLWLAEGFTSYYGPLIMLRSGLTRIEDFAAEMTDVINTVRNSPGRAVHTAEAMSRLAPFVDAAVSVDRTVFDNTYISYYTWGAAIALGLDLSLRDRSDGKLTLDAYMRALWQTFGKPPGPAPGIVANAYTVADLKSALASVTGDARFADDFFARFIQGHDVVDYERLLERMGFLLRPSAPGRAFAGELRLQDVQGRARVAASVPFGSPVYAAGLERDDVILAVGGVDVAGAVDVERIIGQRKPGDEIALVFERRGQRVSGMMRLSADPRVEVVPAERAGRTLSAEQRRQREAWLSSPRNVF